MAYRFGLRHPKMRVIFENDENRSTLLAHGGFTEAQTTLIRGMGTDMRAFAPAPARVTPPVVVAFASRLLYDKGVGEFMEAARRFSARRHDVRMLVVGDPDPSNPSSVPQAQIDAWAAEGVADFLGHRADMPEVLSAADVVCLPSYYPEGVPRILIEAAACGRPAITTNTPGCRHVVIDGVTGLLVPPRDVDALVAAIDRLVRDPALRASFGIAARAHAVEHFSREAVIASTLDVFDELFQC
jgi:glycosyltransferase involved in cell wall biosynthesis